MYNLYIYTHIFLTLLTSTLCYLCNHAISKLHYCNNFPTLLHIDVFSFLPYIYYEELRVIYNTKHIMADIFSKFLNFSPFHLTKAEALKIFPLKLNLKAIEIKNRDLNSIPLK